MAETGGIKSTNTGSKQSMKKELGQIEINMVEERLTLAGGTLPQEFGTTLANRFGKALKMSSDATTDLSYVDKRYKNPEEKKKQTGLIMKRIAEAKLARAEEVAKYTKIAMEYVKETYGKERRNSGDVIVGYGDEIEVLKNRHLKKVW